LLSKINRGLSSILSDLVQWVRAGSECSAICWRPGVVV
jgi:hypothetical protein